MKTAMMKPCWAEHELGQAGLVDKRLVKRLIKIATDFYQQPQAALDWGVLSAKHSLGLLIHPTLATTWNGTPRGLVDLQAWRRRSRKKPTSTCGGH